jgi:uncharacterized protein YdgA (DUF945 family)
MKKIVASGLFLILLALFGATYFGSRQTEAAFRAQVGQLREHYAGIMQVSLEEYQAGLFLSRARLRLGFSAGGSMGLHQQIRHFPWGARMVTRLSEDSELARELARALPLEKLQLVTEVGWRGQSDSTLELPELTWTDAAGEWRLGPLRFGCKLAATLGKGLFWLKLPALTWRQAERERLRLRGLELQGRFGDQPELPLEDAAVRIDRLLVGNHQQVLLEVRDFRSSAQLRRVGTTVTGFAEFGCAELILVGEPFTQGRVQLRLVGIDAAVVDRLLKNLQQIHADLLSRRVDPLVLQLQLFGLFQELVGRGLELHLEPLELRSAAGELRGKGFLGLRPPGPAGGSPLTSERVDAELQLDFDSGVFASGFRLLDKLQHQGRASANPAVLDELAEQLAGGLIQKGLLSKGPAGGYRLELSIEQGVGRLNGQPFPP